MHLVTAIVDRLKDCMGNINVIAHWTTVQLLKARQARAIDKFWVEGNSRLVTTERVT
jgi:hypothetical protein